jgi:hypothetical protein
MLIHQLPEGVVPDVRVDGNNDEGVGSTFYILTPLTDVAREWCTENIAADPEPDGGYICEHRYVEDIMGAMESYGLYFKAGFGFRLTEVSE